jgi:long-subunit fatty acid transport protein
MKIRYFLLIFLFATEMYSQGGNSGLKFLTSTESRVSSLGETSIINSCGASATIGNPAAMNSCNSSEVQIGVLRYLQDVNSQYLLLKIKSSDVFSWGVHILNYTISDIEIRDLPGEVQGTFSSQYLSTGLSGAYKINDQLNVGITAKFLYEKIFVDDASGFGIDLGGYYQFNDNLHFGLGINNIGSMNNLRNESTKLPLTGGFGASYKFDVSILSNLAAVELKNNFEDKKSHLSLALESQYNKLISIRFGYISGYDTKDITAGFGVQFSDLKLNYSFIPYSNNLGDYHSISLSYSI